MTTTIEAASGEPNIEHGSFETDLYNGNMTMNVGYRWRCGIGSSLVLSQYFNWEYYSFEQLLLKNLTNMIYRNLKKIQRIVVFNE